MAVTDGFYSRVISGLKIGLPLAALALLSTLFLFARSTEPSGELPFADLLDENALTGEQVGTPYFAGKTERGDLLTMTAKRARPDGIGRIRADDIVATLALIDGSRLNLNAAEANLIDADNQAMMRGGVTVISSSGYRLQTDALRAAIRSIDAETLGPVTGSGPAGTLEAGKLHIRPDGKDGDVQLLFTGGVKLVYVPQKAE